jgi:hypothetical protein
MSYLRPQGHFGQGLRPEFLLVLLFENRGVLLCASDKDRDGSAEDGTLVAQTLPVSIKKIQTNKDSIKIL